MRSQAICKEGDTKVRLLKVLSSWSGERCSHRHDDHQSDAAFPNVRAVGPRPAGAVVDLCPLQEHTRLAGLEPVPRCCAHPRANVFPLPTTLREWESRTSRTTARVRTHR